MQQLLQGIYSTIVLRDIVNRRSIRGIVTFEAVVRSDSADAALSYLAYLCEVSVFDRVDRFDLKGKRHLQVNSECYLGGLGLRRGLLGAQDRWIAGDLGNFVHHELLRRGYRVSVGVFGTQEIDFVAEGPSGRVYNQICYLFESPATLEREKSALLAPGDAFPNVMVSLDPGPPGGLDGMRHLNAVAPFSGEPLPGES